MTPLTLEEARALAKEKFTPKKNLGGLERQIAEAWEIGSALSWDRVTPQWQRRIVGMVKRLKEGGML